MVDIWLATINWPMPLRALIFCNVIADQVHCNRVRCVSGSLPQDTNSSYSSNRANRKIEASNDPQAFVLGAACTERSTLDTIRPQEAENCSEVHSNGVSVPSELSKGSKHHIGGNSQTCESNVINSLL